MLLISSQWPRIPFEAYPRDPGLFLMLIHFPKFDYFPVTVNDDVKPRSPQSDDPDKIRLNNNNQLLDDETNTDDSSPPKSQGLIKSRGTYFPLTAFPTSMPQGSVMRRDLSPPGTDKSIVGQ